MAWEQAPCIPHAPHAQCYRKGREHLLAHCSHMLPCPEVGQHPGVETSGDGPLMLHNWNPLPVGQVTCVYTMRPIHQAVWPGKNPGS